MYVVGNNSKINSFLCFNFGCSKMIFLGGSIQMYQINHKFFFFLVDQEFTTLMAQRLLFFAP
jgi:hypothetical protein